jgi:F0F1-type ATP synthase membrane subunit b/b'
MTARERTDEIAAQAAEAARRAAKEARTPEARFFLRQHADLLAKIAASRRRTAETGARIFAPLALLPLGF